MNMASNSQQMAKSLVSLVLITLLFASAISVPLMKRSCGKNIREVNKRGPYIGLVTVYAPEETGFFTIARFKPDPNYPFLDLSGRRFRIGNIHDKRVIYVRCGIGMANAAAATQQMLDVFNVIGIVHFGIAGNANSSLSIGDVIIPQQIADTGLWDWLNPNATVPSDDVGELEFKRFNVPQGSGDNLLGHIGYSNEQFFTTQNPNVPQPLFWANVTQKWLQIASKLQGIELQQCVNASFCLEEKPKLVVGLKGSTANMFVDNAAYRSFLFRTFNVSSLDMESSAVVMTSLSNGFPVIVIRGLSDLAGAQEGSNAISTFGSLASINTAKAVVSFLKNI